VDPLPRPALIVLVGPSGAGKTSWARERYAAGEVVSSDALRAVVGTGEGDLDASRDAFAILDAVVAARVRRGLTTVIDTLGLDADRRAAAVMIARAAGMPVVAVRFITGLPVCRARNRLRDRPVPAPALKSQFQRTATVDLAVDGFDLVVDVDGSGPPSGRAGAAATGGWDAPDPRFAPDGANVALGRPAGLRFALQISAFPWGSDPRGWLRKVAVGAEQAGFDSIAVMDHLLQIPQVGRSWDPIPEAYVTLGYLAGITQRIGLGPLVTPVTFRSAPLLAKMLASLDAVAGPGRVFCGLGAGWYDREHAAYGLPFPAARDRLDALESTIGVLRAFWGPGTKPFGALPETTCYPRPGPIPIIVGGGGERRTLELAARLADGCNLVTGPALSHKIGIFREHAARAGRPAREPRITVLDVPIVGADPDQVAALVEARRGRSSAKAYAAAHHAGTVAAHIERYAELAEHGVDTVFVSFPDLAGPAQIERFEPVLRAFGEAGGPLRTP
jgi:alkanesulfonate monooxygenase SsuD/methylene tetrahydromethanopterin reductase-like flavin-dependent oxidoreductase (luciferase family)/predicted kinase